MLIGSGLILGCLMFAIEAELGVAGILADQTGSGVSSRNISGENLYSISTGFALLMVCLMFALEAEFGVAGMVAVESAGFGILSSVEMIGLSSLLLMAESALVVGVLAVEGFEALREIAREDFGLGLRDGARGLANFVSILSGLRGWVGSAVPGRLISFFAGRIGRTGAEFREPAVGSGELGLSRPAEAACFARFCASIVSLRDGLDTALVKLRAMLGFLSSLVVSRATSENSAGLGLAECLRSSS